MDTKKTGFSSLKSVTPSSFSGSVFFDDFRLFEKIEDTHFCMLILSFQNEQWVVMISRALLSFALSSISFLFVVHKTRSCAKSAFSMLSSLV